MIQATLVVNFRAYSWAFGLFGNLIRLSWLRKGNSAVANIVGLYQQLATSYVFKPNDLWSTTSKKSILLIVQIC